MAADTQILDAAVQSGEMGVIHLGDLDVKPLFQSESKIQEIHGIELELIAESFARLDVIDVCFRGNLPEKPQNDLLDVCFQHFRHSPLAESPHVAHES
jgi:hypothetical protein